MIVSLLAIGSRGDVQPVAALAERLASRGHEARLIAPDAFEDLLSGRGAKFCPMGFDVMSEFHGEGTRRLFEGGGSFVAYVNWLISLPRRFSMAVAPRLQELTKGSDVILGSGFMQSFGVALSELWGAHSVNAWFWPCLASRDFLVSLTRPSPVALPKSLNRLAFQVGDHLVWSLARPVVNQVRKSYGLAPSGFTPNLRQSILSGEPLLLAYSEELLPRSSDWPDNVQVTGYWRLEHSKGWEPPAELNAFLGAGPPPVYVGFGSMAIRDPEATMTAILQAIRGAKTRAVICAGWGRLVSDRADADVLVIDEAPHDWLFPKMSAIIHHGGSGTTGAALHAGKPSVVVPFIMDQFFWGEHVCKRGVGPDPVPYKTLTRKTLQSAIERALNDQAMRARAAEVGLRIQAEDGLAKAVETIERGGTG